MSTENEKLRRGTDHGWELRVLSACALVATAAWIYLLIAPMPMDMGRAWNGSEGMLLVTMWSVMMLAMMLPSATGIMSLLSRNPNAASRTKVTWMFSLGYFMVWLATSATAAGAQWMLHDAGVMRNGMEIPEVIGGIVLIVAGAYQFHPLKNRCLVRCRDPLGFLMTSWRDGSAGALRMGIDYGVICLGCCWALMLVLFAVGVMNLLAVAALAALIALEKMSRFGRQLSRVTGAALVVGGLLTVAAKL